MKLHNQFGQLAGSVEYTDCKTPLMSVLDMTRNKVPVMLELWGMQSTSSLPLLPGPLWPGVVAPGGPYLWVK